MDHPAPHYLSTGQRQCWDPSGVAIACAHSGQDAEYAPGAPWPRPRFAAHGEVAADLLTGLTWTIDANPAGFPLTWREALEHVAELNQASHLGFTDWRLPNRRELKSLISHQAKKPALPEGHPFRNVFQGWYWTSSTAAINPAFAWYVHTEGGRMFFGHKEQAFLLWPVRGAGNGLLPATGQTLCFDSAGRVIEPDGSGQDGELGLGAPWPEPRFTKEGATVVDHLTGLVWTGSADLAAGPVDWSQALAKAAGLAQSAEYAGKAWRLPTINELESLVDASAHTPALPTGHPFTGLADGYWSSTTSAFEPDWGMALYLNKGAVGVGQKKGRHFHVWAVAV